MAEMLGDSGAGAGEVMGSGNVGMSAEVDSFGGLEAPLATEVPGVSEIRKPAEPTIGGIPRGYYETAAGIRYSGPGTILHIMPPHTHQ
jgi:hypothetical protein